MKPLVIFGSAREDGDTRRALECVFEAGEADIVNLLDKSIGYFDYAHANRGDDFLPLAEEMTRRQAIVFATPVYWYSMSAVLKNFLDRFTDLVTIEKKLGRALKDKQCYVISAGSQRTLPPGFEYPFSASCGYLEMQYKGAFYRCTGKEAEPAAHYKKAGRLFFEEIMQGM